jgi:hypothetical protein
VAESAADQVGVEGVVAVLDQHRAAREAEEGGSNVGEAGRAREHRAVDLVALLRVAVDRRPALDQGVEEGQGADEVEALGPDLDDQERAVAGRFNVECDELRLLQGRLVGDRLRLPNQLLEEDFRTGSRLEPDAEAGRRRTQ